MHPEAILDFELDHGLDLDALRSIVVPTTEFFVNFQVHVHAKLETSILRQSRRLYGCGPLKGMRVKLTSFCRETASRRGYKAQRADRQ